MAACTCVCSVHLVQSAPLREHRMSPAGVEVEGRVEEGEREKERGREEERKRGREGEMEGERGREGGRVTVRGVRE